MSDEKFPENNTGNVDPSTRIPPTAPQEDLAEEVPTMPMPTASFSVEDDAKAKWEASEAELIAQGKQLGKEQIESVRKQYVNADFTNGGLVAGSTPAQAMSEKRGLTFGEKLVGKTFNPSNNPKVDRAKALCAELADLVVSHDCSNSSGAFNVPFYQGALDRILDAQMWSVKYLTNQY